MRLESEPTGMSMKTSTDSQHVLINFSSNVTFLISRFVASRCSCQLFLGNPIMGCADVADYLQIQRLETESTRNPELFRRYRWEFCVEW